MRTVNVSVYWDCLVANILCLRVPDDATEGEIEEHALAMAGRTSPTDDWDHQYGNMEVSEVEDLDDDDSEEPLAEFVRNPEGELVQTELATKEGVR